MRTIHHNKKHQETRRIRIHEQRYPLWQPLRLSLIHILLSIRALGAQTLRMAIAPVLRGTHSFFVREQLKIHLKHSYTLHSRVVSRTKPGYCAHIDESDRRSVSNSTRALCACSGATTAISRPARSSRSIRTGRESTSCIPITVACVRAETAAHTISSPASA